MDNLYLIIGLVAAMAMIIVIVVLALRLSDGKRRLEDEKRSKDEALSMQKEGYEARLSELKASNEKALSELKAQQEKAVAEQVAAVRAEMTSRTEEILKAREESLKTSAEASIKSITGVLDENVKAMKEAFEKNKETQTATSASLKTQLADAVASLQRQTVEIGSKADSLASAMRGSNKIQGDWGEVVLENMLKQEGMKEGRDYDAQTTLRDEGGTIALSEDEKRLRPDFVLHYPDGFDIIVDSKVNLSAYYDWTQASDEASRNDAMLRHLRAVKSQVLGLSKKDYSHYISPGRKRTDFVVMFVPVYPALRLAYQADSDLWQWARSQNVLLTTEETIMPFLRIIRMAWTNLEQVQNQELIIQSAEMMIERVSDFCKGYKAVGDKLEAAMKEYAAADIKLRNTGPSIVTSARKVISYGVRPSAKKPLPPQLGELETEVHEE